MTPNEMLALARAFHYARSLGTPETTTAYALRLVRADMGWPTVARCLPVAFAAAVFNARAWLHTASEIIEGANSLRRCDDVETRDHHPDCPAIDGFGCRCPDLGYWAHA